VGVSTERSRAILTIDDSGPGIPAAQRERIFDRFHRATDQRSGAGLGLAIADAIVRATGGAWEVGSSPVGGARMSVSWPGPGGPPGHDVARNRHRAVGLRSADSNVLADRGPTTPD
jgi:signal transduction histidine kinase